ncbi:MAG: diaminopimelate epimerase [Oscillospiraceae bacterium]|nr:diaminopimelate epimerase [Oscillospiraceae bacterium]
MRFTKMHGAGNDYIYVDCFSQDVNDPTHTAKILSRPHFGIGSDGLVLIKPSNNADCFMDIYNADGSRAKMCGNAVRCTAKYAYDSGNRKSVIDVDTLSGTKSVELIRENGNVTGGRVNMGKPILNGHSIPTRFGSSIVKGESLSVDNKNYEITCLSMGNPHCVVFCDGVDSLDLSKIGPLFEHHEMFPERINTEFVEVKGGEELTVRVWERGSGETLACGTGACAAAVASVINGLSKKNREIKINLPGGTLFADWTENGDVYLTGPAVTVFTGETEVL